MNKKRLAVISAAVVVFIAGTLQFLAARSTVSPIAQTATPTVEQNVGTITTPSTVTANVNNAPKNQNTHPLPLANGDNIVSWNFKGAYANNPELTAKARAEIRRLSDILATATSSYMITAVGIANQYELLGDGEKQYEYLERAVRMNPENGLPWHNLGVLMERLGAYETARIAYEKSTLVQSELKFYHYAYIEFLTSRKKGDTINIEKAFSFAEKNIGKTQYLIELRAEWEKS